MQPEFERIVLPFVRNLERMGITARVRTVDASQYQKRMDTFDYDMAVVSFGQSLSPGNEQRDYWGSQAAGEEGSRNILGIKNPVIDALVEEVIKAPDRDSLVAHTRALDRVLQWGFYVIPHYHTDVSRVAYWDKFRRPEIAPKYGIGLDTWWIDPKAEQTIEAKKGEVKNGEAKYALLRLAMCAASPDPSRAHYSDMDFDLSDEQRAFQETARQFARDEWLPYAPGWDEREEFPEEALRKAAALGFAGIYVGEKFGGSGLSRLDATIIFEELATACVSTAAYLSIHNMAAWMIDRFGDEATRARFLPKLMSMEHFASYCLTEPGSGSDAAALQTRARRDGDRLRAERVEGVHLGRGAQRPLCRRWCAPAKPARRASRALSSRTARRVCPSARRRKSSAGTRSRPPR